MFGVPWYILYQGQKVLEALFQVKFKVTVML